MERLAQIARELREKPVPAGCCARCYARHCRALHVGCCVCSGDIDLARKDIFSRD
jgi:hypothetical protein